MPTPHLTIGMATINEYEGLWLTLKSLAAYHGDVVSQSELIVVDNDPDSEIGRANFRLFKKMKPCFLSSCYIAMRQPKGTQQPRNAIFTAAKSEHVVVMDSHVMLLPNALNELLDYYCRNPGCSDLLQGPLMKTPNTVAGTHQELRWSTSALGKWSTDERGLNAGNDPFEIPQQGMGLFSCRRDAWVGFHSSMHGFGGCETYVAQKFRDRGDRVLCCPWFRWEHMFLPKGCQRSYQPRIIDKVRNYTVGFLSLGMDISGVVATFAEHLNDVDQQLLERELREIINHGETVDGESATSKRAC